MPTIPLLSPGAQLLNTGVRTLRVANIAPDNSGAVYGQVLNQASDALGKFAEERRKANDAKGLFQIETDLRNLSATQRDYQNKTVDQEEWPGYWDNITGEYEKNVLAKVKLSQEGKDIALRTFGRYKQERREQIQQEAFSNLQGRVRMDLKTRIAMAETPEEVDGTWPLAERAGIAREEFGAVAEPAKKEKGLKLLQMRTDDLISNNGPAGLQQAIKEIRESPFLGEEAKKSTIKNAEYAAEVADFGVMSYNDPFMALELAPLKLRGPDQLKVERAARARIEEIRGEKLKGYEESIKLGNPPDPEALKNERELSDYDKASILDFALSGPKNDPASYAQLMASAANFKGDESSPEYAVLSQQINLALDGDLQSRALAQLGKSVSNKDPDALTRSQNEVYKRASDDMNAGRFGTWERPILQAAVLPQDVRAKVDAIKATLAKEKGFFTKTPKDEATLEKEARTEYFNEQVKNMQRKPEIETFMVTDEQEKSIVSRRYQDILGSIEEWKANNPKATPQEFQSFYDRSTVRYRAFAPQTTGEMPPIDSGGAEMNNPLLPSIEQTLKKHGQNP